MDSINEDDIRAEVDSLSADISTVALRSHEDVLGQILEGLAPVNFHDEADLGERQAVSWKVLLVVVVRQVLRVADALGVGLCRHNDFLYSFNGAFWRSINEAELASFFGTAATRVGVDEITAAYHKFRESLIKQFFAVAHLPSPAFLEGVVLINLLNGTFEITAAVRRLREFRRQDFLTYQLPFAYVEGAACPKWMSFLDRVLPDGSRQDVLAEYFAYIFTNLKLEKTLLLFGTGANGKSVVFDVLRKLLGPENISHFSFNSLTREYHRACLANKLLNYASEISSKLEADIFKKLTSGEPVDARVIYGKPFIMTRYAKLAVNCNELPRDVEHNEAFFRRFLIIPFDVFIPEEERNPNLAREIISEELSGVFNWVLGGLERLLAQGNFSSCPAAREVLNTYRKESDSVAMFMEEVSYRKVSCAENATRLKAINNEYRAYCNENRFRALSSTNLRRRLVALGFESQKTNAGRLVYVSRSENDF
jgi:putative DNA primase/helicase